MKNILAAAAITLMASTAAFADGHSTLKTYTTDAATGDFSASALIGMRVYSAEADYDTFNADTVLPDDSEQNWDDIGEINDIIVNRDGSIKAVVLGIGGFIGIGEKDVAIPMDSLKMVNEADDAGDFFVVVKTNKEALEAAPEYVKPAEVAEAAEEQAEKAAAETEEAAETAEAEVAETTTTETVVPVTPANESDDVVTPAAEGDDAVMVKEDAAEEVTQNAEADSDPSSINTTAGRTMLVRPEVEREGYTMATMDQLTTEDLTGARVYGAADEDVGEIDEILVDTSGKIEAAVLGIGGFIGIGERDIRVTMEELNIMRSEDGDVRVYIDATKENLEAQPAYEG